MNNNWFESRGLRVLNYQYDAITKVQESMSQREITVLAAAPSAGKTLMTIYIIEEYLKQNPNHEVLVLAHGTTILRTQFHNVLEEIKPDFSFNLVEKFTDYDGSDVNVCLPQTLAGNDLNKIDLLVVDEAHQFYFAEKMMKEIIKKSKPKKQLLLTGTPSPFIRKGFKIIPVTLNTIFDEGMISDLFVEIATSSYTFDPMTDFNSQDELKTDVYIKDSETKKTLDDLIGKIVDRLKSIKDNPYQNLLPEWLPTLKKLQKTMIACRSQHQAMQVKSYFDKIGVTSALSISDIDYDSKEIERFKNESDCLILIVVGRGILGFNYPELVNVVDMTTSQNVDRIYQLLCRVIRKHPEGHKKLFFKIAPNIHSDYYKYIMTAVLSLADETFFTKFNGKNFSDMIIPVIKTKREHHEPNNGGGNGKPRPKTLKPIDFEGLPVFEFFKDLYHKKDALLHIYAYTTVRDVRAEFLNYTPAGYWTFDKCLESALKYKKLEEWYHNDGGALQAARRNGWYEKCTLHMDIGKNSGYWTKERCIEDAKEYNTIRDWTKNNTTPYSVARTNGWLNECTKHMTNLRPKLTKERCIENAKKYNSITDWIKSMGGGSEYKFAHQHDWYNDCISHMPEYIHPKALTKERCIETSKNYTKPSDWKKYDSTTYKFACENGLLKECCSHMKDGVKYWTKEEVIESVKKYTSYSLWRKENPKIYNYARKYGMIDELTSHMNKMKTKSNSKPHFYYTKEKVIESASKYTNLSDWQKNNPTAYAKAKKKGWFNECTAHMPKPKRWTYDLCAESAKKYSTIMDWVNNDSGAYNFAKRHGYVDELTKHMVRKNHQKYTLEECITIAKNFKSVSEWNKNSSGSYSAAWKNGWIKECTKHMKYKYETNQVNEM